jgi:hypothetical protein
MGCAAVATAAAVGGVEHANAAVIYSGAQNIQLTYGPPGLYINLVTKASSTVPASVPGWDINPYVHSPNFLIYSPAKLTFVKSSVDVGAGDTAKLPAGASIGSSSTFVNYFDGFMNNNSIGEWTGAGSGYLGIKFSEAGVNGGSPMYGWIQISKNAGTPTAAPTGINILDWAYDNSGASISAGNVPEPSSLALLAAGATGLCVRRRRAKLRGAEA